MKISVNRRIYKLLGILDTPTIVYDQYIIDYIVNLLKRDTKNVKNIEICFSIKANSNKEVLKIFKNHGLGVEVASIEELKIAKSIGFNSIYCTSPGMSKEKIEYIYSNNVIFDFDSINQLAKWSKYNKNKSIGIRFKPESYKAGLNSRFGISNLNSLKLKELIDKNDLKLKQLHLHIGQKKDVYQFNNILNEIERNIRSLDIFDELEKINLGGGIDHLYVENYDINTFWNLIEEFRNRVANVLKKDLHIVIEPGTFLVNLAGFLYTKVINERINIKENLQELTIDASPFNLLAWSNPKPIKNTSSYNELVNTKIFGPTCYEEDFFNTTQNLPRLVIDDDILYHPVGAYVTSIMSSLHNLEKPKELVLTVNNQLLE